MARTAPSAPRGAPAFALAALAALSALAGCSDPVPPPAQGAVSFEMGGGVNCPITSSVQDLKLGAVDPQRTTPLVDGETGTVYCKVAPKGNAFDVTLTINSGGDTFSLTGLIVPNNTTEALISLFTNATQSTYQSAPPGGCTGSDCGESCRVSFPAPSDPASPTFGVSAGRIWAAFECPELRDARSGDAAAYCSVPSFSGQPGYFAFENCDEE